ncbi:hypothetical protein BS329_38735 [Amycolatopsis coloradensis]|uniref:Uncharacterized protein n=2 Tax=Amycolatopsis coloradensis TaxID=76021 RepID=A0A1R0KEP6_9PSEU|nr:hypothetical protein BS329_38735 [Amycolatopsis coloradensis]
MTVGDVFDLLWPHVPEAAEGLLLPGIPRWVAAVHPSRLCCGICAEAIERGDTQHRPRQAWWHRLLLDPGTGRVEERLYCSVHAEIAQLGEQDPW